jgi:hypothetical protein
MVDSEGIAELVLRHRHDLRQATGALIAAANDHGGDDNVTAVLFEVADASSRSGDTREAPAVPAADPDEADTLHPEDGVVLPATADDGPYEPAQGDTVIVSAADLAAAAAAESEADTAVHPASDAAAGQAAHGGEEGAPLWRYALSVLVIVALAVLIVLLVTRGLAR